MLVLIVGALLDLTLCRRPTSKIRSAKATAAGRPFEGSVKPHYWLHLYIQRPPYPPLLSIFPNNLLIPNYVYFRRVRMCLHGCASNTCILCIGKQNICLLLPLHAFPESPATYHNIFEGNTPIYSLGAVYCSGSSIDD
jgi:hypothetical protein